MADRAQNRVVIALSGNAIAAGGDDASSQQAAVAEAMEPVADLVDDGYQPVLTFGNGPQVGNILAKNELAREQIAPVPLHWCGVQTQGSLGFLIINCLDNALRRRGLERTLAAVLTRTIVDADDPDFAAPTKPIGAYVPEAEAQTRVAAGELWEDRGKRGWRRLVGSPDPIQILEQPAIEILLADDRTIVVAGGGGGVPVVAGDNGLESVDAVIDKDLYGALIGGEIGASTFVIATDVSAAAINFGTDHQEWIGFVTPARLRALAAQGHFAAGSMAPKVEAVARFVEQGGSRAAIGSVANLVEAVAGEQGTVVEPEEARTWSTA